MTVFPYTISPQPLARLGLVVLQTDETLEEDFRRLIPKDIRWLVSRVPAAPDVSQESLQAIGAHIPVAAGLLPQATTFDGVAYCCTSGAAQVGPEQIARLLRAGARTRGTTDPVSALLAACQTLGLKRLAVLSPYVAQVSARLREVLGKAGIETPVFGTFDEPSEAAVINISEASVASATRALVAKEDVDGVFLSCTNLHTLDVIPTLEDTLDMPVLSSNLVLAWDLLRLAGQAPPKPGDLLGHTKDHQ